MTYIIIYYILKLCQHLHLERLQLQATQILDLDKSKYNFI